MTGTHNDGSGQMLKNALATSFPNIVDNFIPLFYLLLGFSTITAFYVVGIQCFEYIRHGSSRYFHVFAVCMFLVFSFIPSDFAVDVMGVFGACLLESY